MIKDMNLDLMKGGVKQMSEPEGYADVAKEDDVPKEYIAKVVYYLNFQDRVEPPSESEIQARIKSKCFHGTFMKSLFEIESVETA